MSDTKQAAFSDNTAGALAYIAVLPAVAFLVLVPYKKSPFVRFHAWQSIFLGFFALVFSYALGYVLAFFGVRGEILAVPTTWLFIIFWILVWVFCAVSALNGKSIKLPLIGAFAQKQANG